ncbi:MAG: cobaltochelatase subunit CobT, partial [Magnetospirillum sp.]|nr:cobaltochelatase subunit CobT [Magnetospirillum sp.]
MPERNAADPSSHLPVREESPADTMKRATALVLRAIAGRADLEVGFVAGAASVRGAEIKLPSPQKNLTQGDLVRLRGTADAVALRFRYHDDAVHAKRMPPDPQARKVYEAVEQARIEALGARRMAGIGNNIAAVLEQKARAEGLDRITKRDDMPLAEAMRFIAREHFLGEDPPLAAENAVNLWRPFVEEKIGPGLDRLKEMLADEEAFAGGLKDLLHQLDIFTDNELET